jgi:SAM-dependent methyltransferase
MTMICPICNGTEFTIYNKRPVASCVNCRSLERGRLQFIIFQHLGLPKRQSRILHIAPERHLHKLFRECSGELYHPCDFEPDNKNYKKLGGRIYEIDLCRDIFRFPTNSFDLIVHNHVLEHIPCEVSTVLAEHKRVLAPGGSLVFSVPFRGSRTDEDLSPDLTVEERLRRFGQSDHVRIFGTSDFPKVVQKVFGQDLLFRANETWSNEQLEAWASPPDLAAKLSGVSNFVWQKPIAT